VTSARDRAVVLGGGGVAGIGWQLGLLSGLAESRLDVRLDAGLFVGHVCRGDRGGANN